MIWQIFDDFVFRTKKYFVEIENCIRRIYDSYKILNKS